MPTTTSATCSSSSCSSSSSSSPSPKSKRRICLCNAERWAPDDSTGFGVQCDRCRCWYHGKCLAITPEHYEEIRALPTWVCPLCEDPDDPLPSQHSTRRSTGALSDTASVRQDSTLVTVDPSSSSPPAAAVLSTPKKARKVTEKPPRQPKAPKSKKSELLTVRKKALKKAVAITKKLKKDKKKAKKAKQKQKSTAISIRRSRKQSLHVLATARRRWRWQSKHQFMRVQTLREDQGACTPDWVLWHLRQRWGEFFDPCPSTSGAADPADKKPSQSSSTATTTSSSSSEVPSQRVKKARKRDGLKVPWQAVNYINPPFRDAKAWFEKGQQEAKKGHHSIFLVPASRIHRAYFCHVFPAVKHIQLMSRTIAFKNYDDPLPHGIMLMHMGPGVSAQLSRGKKVTPLHTMKVPVPSSFEQVRQMVQSLGYVCYVLDNVLTTNLDQVMRRWHLANPTTTTTKATTITTAAAKTIDTKKVNKRKRSEPLETVAIEAAPTKKEKEPTDEISTSVNTSSTSTVTTTTTTTTVQSVPDAVTPTPENSEARPRDRRRPLPIMYLNTATFETHPRKKPRPKPTPVESPPPPKRRGGGGALPKKSKSANGMATPFNMAILFPSRLENRVVHSEVLPHAVALFACTGCLRPTESQGKVWSPSILAVFGDVAYYERLRQHPWVSKSFVPVTSFDVDKAMSEYDRELRRKPAAKAAKPAAITTISSPPRGGRQRRTHVVREAVASQRLRDSLGSPPLGVDDAEGGTAAGSSDVTPSTSLKPPKRRRANSNPAAVQAKPSAQLPPQAKPTKREKATPTKGKKRKPVLKEEPIAYSITTTTLMDTSKHRAERYLTRELLRGYNPPTTTTTTSECSTPPGMTPCTPLLPGGGPGPEPAIREAGRPPWLTTTSVAAAAATVLTAAACAAAETPGCHSAEEFPACC